MCACVCVSCVSCVCVCVCVCACVCVCVCACVCMCVCVSLTCHDVADGYGFNNKTHGGILSKKTISAIYLTAQGILPVAYYY